MRIANNGELSWRIIPPLMAKYYTRRMVKGMIYNILLYIGIYLAAVNLLAVGMTIYDKNVAKTGSWRVKERTLLLVSAAGGSVAELAVLLEKLTEYYGKRPVIYTLADSYDLYISGGFTKYAIWYRDVISTPKINDSREFVLWQFSNRHRLDGYNGKERYIDMNVFNGSFEKFEAFVRGSIS